MYNHWIYLYICNMEIRNLHQPFELELQELQDYQVTEHTNTFFEMVFVLEGKGVQIINNHRLPYAADKLFLIFPQDSHDFEISTTTKLFFIRFNDSYLKTQSKDWIQKLEFIFHNHNHLPGCILKTVTDKPLVRSLVEALIREHTHHDTQQQELIKQLINTIITVAARNITLIALVLAGKEHVTDAVSMLNYIHRNIYQPEELSTQKLASYFHVSPTYISEYFKTKTGQSIQQYITGYRMKLIETRLRYTDMQINEMVYEFGFSDASHLNKQFKKYTGMNPTEYRKSVMAK